MLQKYNFEVKQLSEFFDRFNYKERVNFANNLKSTRSRNIICLFNLKDSSLSHSPETANFIKFAGTDSNKVYLDFGDNNWFAFASSSFLYHGKNILINIVLKPDGNSTTGFKWIIADVKGDIFPLVKKRNFSMGFINPMNHEVGFSELARALTKKSDMLLYTSTIFQADPLSAFLFMVKNGDLKFIQINSIDFLFLQVKDWAFTVKDFNRADFNSGWLISSLKNMSETEKSNYIKNHFVN